MEEKKPLKEFRMKCKVCDTILKLQGNEENLERWLDQPTFSCPGRHIELSGPRTYLSLVEVTEIDKPFKWIPNPERSYQDIHKIQGLEHCGFGIFKNPSTGDIFDFEQDEEGRRHYYTVK